MFAAEKHGDRTNVAQNNVVGGDAIRGDEEKQVRVGGSVDVADLAPVEQLQAVQIAVYQCASHIVQRIFRRMRVTGKHEHSESPIAFHLILKIGPCSSRFGRSRG